MQKVLTWFSFASFELRILGDEKYLLPVFTTEKFFEEHGKRMLPLVIEVHHAVCDGYHIGRFIEILQEKINTFHE